MEHTEGMSVEINKWKGEENLRDATDIARDP